MTDTDWAARLAAMVADHQRRAAARRAIRADLAERRRHGLEARQAARHARAQQHDGEPTGQHQSVEPYPMSQRWPLNQTRGGAESPPTHRLAAPVGYASGRVNHDERARLAATLGTVLRQHRTRAGLTQLALGELADASRATVYQLENGRVRPSTLMLWRLAVALTGAVEEDTLRVFAELRAAAGPSLRISPPGTGWRGPPLSARSTP
jgi:DNA-binding XRE family transcriptional regulator